MRTRSKKKPKKNGPPLESKVSNISYFRVLVVIPKTVTWITFLDNLCGILELEWYRLLNFFRIENFFISLTVFSAASFFVSQRNGSLIFKPKVNSFISINRVSYSFLSKLFQYFSLKFQFHHWNRCQLHFGIVKSMYDHVFLFQTFYRNWKKNAIVSETFTNDWMLILTV